MAGDPLYTLYGMAVPHPSVFNSSAICTALCATSTGARKQKIDVKQDINDFQKMESDDLVNLCKSLSRPIRRPRPYVGTSALTTWIPPLVQSTSDPGPLPAGNSDANHGSGGSINNATLNKHMKEFQGNEEDDPNDDD